jgi:hypothetical protein
LANTFEMELPQVVIVFVTIIVKTGCNNYQGSGSGDFWCLEGMTATLAHIGYATVTAGLKSRSMAIV